MNEMKNENRPQGPIPNVPNMNLIKGLLAIIFGLTFMVWSYKIIFHMALFVIGGMLIYYGLAILGVKSVTNYVDQVASKVKKFLYR